MLILNLMKMATFRLKIGKWNNILWGTKMSVKVRNGYFHVIKNGKEVACFKSFSQLAVYLQVMDYMGAH